MLKRKISRAKNRAHGNLSPYTRGPFYDIDHNEEMRILRASPTSRVSENGDAESGHRVRMIINCVNINARILLHAITPHQVFFATS